jgi:hypothetical protein
MKRRVMLRGNIQRTRPATSTRHTDISPNPVPLKDGNPGRKFSSSRT